MYGWEIVWPSRSAARRRRTLAAAGRVGRTPRAARAPSPRGPARPRCRGRAAARRPFGGDGSQAARAYAGASIPKCPRTKGATPAISGRRALGADDEHRDDRSPSRSDPCDPPPAWWRPPRSANSTPPAAETSTSPAFGSRAPVARDPASRRRRHRAELAAVPQSHGRAVLREQRDIDGILTRKPLGNPARGCPCRPSRPVRRGDQALVADPVLEPCHTIDVGLAVIRAHDDRVALQELVEPPAASTRAHCLVAARRSAPRRRGRARERRSRSRAGSRRGSRSRPASRASGRPRSGVDRPTGAGLDCKRRTRNVGLEEAEVKKRRGPSTGTSPGTVGMCRVRPAARRCSQPPP